MVNNVLSVNQATAAAVTNTAVAENGNERKTIVLEPGINEEESLQMHALVVGDRVFTEKPLPDDVSLKSGSKYEILPYDKYDENWVRKYLEYEPEITYPLFFASMFTVVQPFVAKATDANLNFTTAVVGETGRLKTTYVKKFTGLLKNSYLQEVQFDDTKAAKKTIYDLVGLPVLLDDYREKKSGTAYKKQKFSEDLDEFVRMPTQSRPCANLFITAEGISTEALMTSGIDRMLILYLPDISEDKARDLRKGVGSLKREEVVSTMMCFAEKLISNYDDVTQYIKDHLNNCPAPEYLEHCVRLENHVMMLTLTCELFKRYMCNEQNTCDVSELLKNMEGTLLRQMNMLLAAKEQEDGTYVLRAVYRLVTDKEGKTSGIKIIENEDDYKVKVKSELSYALHKPGNDEFYITGPRFKDAMNRLIGRNFVKARILDELDNYGILKTNEINARTIGAFGARQLVIRVSKLKELLKMQ